MLMRGVSEVGPCPGKKLRMAAIMDPFTLLCYQPEADILELTPQGWRRELDAFVPELVFVESAWYGKDRLWQSRLDRYCPEMAGIAAWCRKHYIPLVFWGKEDPVHLHRFLPTAYWADAVFTTAAECIGTYKSLLGHDRVFHLHFAAQPALHNPVELFDRKDKCCFAGGYYADYAERCRIFEDLADFLAASKGLDIFDRFAGESLPLNVFPEKYHPYILGRLAPEEIGRAYKGYLYNLNLNSVAKSPTMFSRRVFELMASNTVVISNHSLGLENCFGDCAICADEAGELRRKLNDLCGDREKLDRFRLRALRQVTREHLYADRLGFVISKVFHKEPEKKLPRVGVYARTGSPEEATRVKRMFARQSYREKELCLIEADGSLEQVERFDYIACFHPHDWYGENYLLDLMLATRFGDFDAIGKGAYFEKQGSGAALRGAGREYHFADCLTARRCAVKPKLIRGKTLFEDLVCSGGRALAVDRFNYCMDWQDECCLAAVD